MKSISHKAFLLISNACGWSYSEMNVYLLSLLILSILFLVTIITALYIRKYDREDLTIAIYILFIAISQIMASRITIFDFGFNQVIAPAAVIIFPFTFQLTDQINEKYGRKATQRMIIIAFITQILAVIFLFLSTTLPQINDNFPAESYNLILFSSMRITIASWVAFLVSENLDAFLFDIIKEKLNGRHLWIRNSVSDVLSLGVDSLIFVPIAFFGVLPNYLIPVLILGQLWTKWLFGLIDTPFIYLDKWLLETKHPLILKLTKLE